MLPLAAKRNSSITDILDCMEEVERHSDSICLFYYSQENLFRDEEGLVVYSIFEIMTANDLLLFKEGRRNMIIQHCSFPELLVELYFMKGR